MSASLPLILTLLFSFNISSFYEEQRYKPKDQGREQEENGKNEPSDEGKKSRSFFRMSPPSPLFSADFPALFSVVSVSLLAVHFPFPFRVLNPLGSFSTQFENRRIVPIMSSCKQVNNQGTDGEEEARKR